VAFGSGGGGSLLQSSPTVLNSSQSFNERGRVGLRSTRKYAVRAAPVLRSLRAVPALLLTVREVAHGIGVSRATVYRWAEEGRLRHVRLSSNVLRFRPEDLAAFIAGRAR
jgi:excisionase family DNA binding protein